MCSSRNSTSLREDEEFIPDHREKIDEGQMSTGGMPKGWESGRAESAVDKSRHYEGWLKRTDETKAQAPRDASRA